MTSRPTAQVLQHVPFEGPGSIADWLRGRGAHIRFTNFFEDPDGLPPADHLDLVVAMGGPMSVNDEHLYPWLVEEKAFLRRCIDGGLPVVGVCLGAQLIASALGARVGPGAEKEIGWYPVEAVHGPDDSVFRFPDRALVFHWHGETFELPAGATRLATSAACANQAFQFGDRVMGLQFHLETTPHSASLLIDNCRDDLSEGRYIQSEAALRAAAPGAYESVNALMDEVLDYVTQWTW